MITQVQDFPICQKHIQKIISCTTKDANKLNIKYQKGVYALYTKPSYETAAEIRAYKILGVDTISM